MGKKGEMTSEMIIGLVILVISFVILIIVFANLYWTPTIDKEACHQSVIFRATAHQITNNPQIIPLKCKTEKICLTNGGDCIYGKSTKKDPISTVKLSSNSEQAKKEVLDSIANSLLDCHTMLGEGKIQFQPNDWTKQNYCLICSRFALDEKTKVQVSKVTYPELYNYMLTKKTLDDKSYLYALYGVSNQDQLSQILTKAIQLSGKTSTNDLTVDLTKENSIIVQVITTGTIGKWAAGAGAAGLTVVGIVFAPFTLGTSLSLVAVGVAGVGGGIVYANAYPDGHDYLAPTIYPYDADSLSKLGCTSFETAP